MKLNFVAETGPELMAVRLVETISQKYPQTFFVGGFVRDMLLSREIYDIDIATIATPQQVSEALGKKFTIDDLAKNFGVLRINNQVEVTTFRTEAYKDSRYPKVSFIDSPEKDSLRRDFTINALYMSLEGDVMDFHGGMGDIGAGLIKFIGDADKRIQEDPLRILRAIRFTLQLDFVLEPTTKDAIQKNFSLLQTLNARQVQTEKEKLSPELQKQFEIIINSKDLT